MQIDKTSGNDFDRRLIKINSLPTGAILTASAGFQ
jgi:hypothetical protein